MPKIEPESIEFQEVLVEVRRRKRRRKVIGAVAIGAVLLLTLGMIWFYGYNYAKNSAAAQIQDLTDRISELETTPIVVEPISPEIVQSVLSGNTVEISELASAEYVFTNAAKFTDTKNILSILDWVTEKSFIQKWDGVITAGVDLEDISVTVAEGVITITLPHARILSYEVDYDSVEVLDERDNIFNPITVEDKSSFDRETADEMKQRAVDNGLLEKAEQNAERIITALLTSSLENMDDYTIEFAYIEN